MTSDPPPRHRRPGTNVEAVGDADFGDELLAELARQLGQHPDSAAITQPGKKVTITIEDQDQEEKDDEKPVVHDMAGWRGYSLASNWLTQTLAQLIVANRRTPSQVAVFLYVAGGQDKGVVNFTQQQITDGLNELAVKAPGARRISRSTVNRAVRALCEDGWLQQDGQARLSVNMRLWFKGNSKAQRDVLDTLADPENVHAFPNTVGPLDLLGDAGSGAPREEKGARPVPPRRAM
jgi:hypothetical protein